MFSLAPFTVAALALFSSVHGAPRRAPNIYDVHHITLPRRSTGNGTIPAAEFTVPLARQLGRKEYKTNMLKRLQPNVVVAAAYFAVEYLVPVTIGGQDFSLILDTGSSDTWVTEAGYSCYNEYGQPLPQSSCSFGPNYYDPSKSTTYKSIPNMNMYIGYGDYSVAFGDVATDTVSIGGLVVPNQEIAVATATVWSHGDDISNGLLGLAYRQLTSAYPGTHSTEDQPGVNNVYYDPFFTNAVNQHLVTAPFFSIALDRSTLDQEAANGYRANVGSLSFGGIVSVPVTQTSAVVPVQGYVVQGGHKVPSNSSTATKFWYTVDIQGYQFPGSEALGSTFSANTILDSGTSVNLLPTAIANAFAASVDPPAEWDDVSSYIVDCNAKVPEFHVRIQDTTFTIDPKDQIQYRAIDDDDNRICQLATTSGGDPSNLDNIFILGGPFLHNVVTTHNIESNEITITQRQPY